LTPNPLTQVEPYRSFVLDTLQAQLLGSPAAGFCLDRMDHAKTFTTARDDGVSWIGGRPAAWMGNSLLGLLPAMRDMTRAARGATCVSLLDPRIDLVGGFDSESRVGRAPKPRPPPAAPLRPPGGPQPPAPP